jgi:hypothetical protein
MRLIAAPASDHDSQKKRIRKMIRGTNNILQGAAAVLGLFREEHYKAKYSRFWFKIWYEYIKYTYIKSYTVVGVVCLYGVLKSSVAEPELQGAA